MRKRVVMTDHKYSDDFFTYLDAGSRRSARTVAALLIPEMRIRSLLDVGAGRGAWAVEWLAMGVEDVIAVDGEYVDRDRLSIPASSFVPHDVATPLDLKRRFDLVQSLEVAEHLAADKASLFVDNLVRHGDVVLFSAAVPHQGGEHHVNEQPPEYWRRMFTSRAYAVFDFLRPRLARAAGVMPWYRFNTYIYANAAGEGRLSAAIRDTLVPGERELDIGGDFAWVLRRAAVRLIPTALVKPIAIARASLAARLKR